ncbi:hypothetical protein LUZ63_001040 [Rhynchospora breviuscula]|uniref:Bifunctional inhibitor/plant lipid transfer protein/seed storage helical domain-containing protein n=1 Tax=Rhynchospora breviuscula TaxID=2022672 RepID=A0A9Q0HWP3_9POAL|nr:hypothetical protein LUZ63_001040 [Rhynchospora breviuscula]
MKTHSKLLLDMASLLLLITTLCAAASTNLLDCDDTLVGLASCLDYVTDASDYPTDECCEQFTGICQAENPCCCAFIDGSANEFLGEPIDPERAENLPYACDYVPGASQARSKPKIHLQLMFGLYHQRSKQSNFTKSFEDCLIKR